MNREGLGWHDSRSLGHKRIKIELVVGKKQHLYRQMEGIAHNTSYFFFFLPSLNHVQILSTHFSFIKSLSYGLTGYDEGRGDDGVAD